MINRHEKLSLVKQCQILNIARSGLYYKPQPISEVDLMLMRLIDEIHLDKPFLGIRRIKVSVQTTTSFPCGSIGY